MNITKLHIHIILSLIFVSNLPGQSDISWSGDIACILYSHCTNCHNKNGVAPFAIETYEDARSRRHSILNAVEEGVMPPWPARYPEQAFVGDHTLSEEEISRIRAWVESDAPEGNPLLAPEIPEFRIEAQIPDADLVIELPEFVVPNLSDNDLYKCFVFPVEMPGEYFVKAIEVIPGNPKAVHHVLLYHDTSNTPIHLDNADPEPGYTCFGGIGSLNAQLVGGWAPGSDPQFFPHNMGIRIPEKTNFVVQVHYPEYAAGESDQTRINIRLTTEPQRELHVLPVLNHFTSMLNGPLVVPPEQIKEFYQQWTVPYNKLTLVGIAPHAHLICTEMECWAETPEGTTIPLVHTPKWDFDWQKFYGYKKAIVLDRGTEIYGRAVYDNTHHNHHNPNNPPQTITVGEDTDEEMMLFFLTFTAYQPGDENLIFEAGTHIDHVGDCSGSVTPVSEHFAGSPEIYPNPGSDLVHIRSDQDIGEVRIYNSAGRLVLHFQGFDLTTLNLSELPRGIYSFQMVGTNQVWISTFIKG